MSEVAALAGAQGGVAVGTRLLGLPRTSGVRVFAFDFERQDAIEVGLESWTLVRVLPLRASSRAAGGKDLVGHAFLKYVCLYVHIEHGTPHCFPDLEPAPPRVLALRPGESLQVPRALKTLALEYSPEAVEHMVQHLDEFEQEVAGANQSRENQFHRCDESISQTYIVDAAVYLLGGHVFLKTAAQRALLF